MNGPVKFNRCGIDKEVPAGVAAQFFGRRDGVATQTCHTRHYILMYFWRMSGGFRRRYDELVTTLRGQGDRVTLVRRWRQLPSLLVRPLDRKARLVVHSSLTAPLVALLKVRHPRLQVIYMVRGDEIGWAQQAHRGLRAMIALLNQRLLRRLGCRFVFVSEDLGKLFERRLGTLPNARLMPNTLGKPLGPIRRFDGSLAIVGDFNSVKNIESILENLSSGRFRVDLYGNTSLPDRFREPWLHAHGVVEDLGAHLRHSSLLVLASRSEGWPNVLLEALEAGCAVVVPRGFPFEHLAISDPWRFDIGKSGQAPPLSCLEQVLERLMIQQRDFKQDNPELIALAQSPWSLHVRTALS